MFHEASQTASFIMNLLSARPESSLIAALTVYLLYQQLTPGKKTQNIPYILFTLFFKSCILILYQYFAENNLCFTVLGDKGYTGETLLQDMRDKGICLMSLKPSNYKQNWSKEIKQLIFRFRRRVETVFSQLSEQFNAESMAFNSIFGEPCDIGKIKHLIF